MATVAWIGTSTAGQFNVGANWSTGSVPVAGDDIVFDGRSSERLDGYTGEDELIATTLDVSGDIHIMPSFTGDIGSDADTPLEIACSGRFIVEGTGTYFIQCGTGSAADTDIATLIINSSGGTVNLSSELNASAGNISEFTAVYIFDGTLNILGAADSPAAAQDGTWVQNLYVLPKPGGRVTVTIGDQCEDFKNSEQITIYQSDGTTNLHTDATRIDQYGGTFNVGSTSYNMDANDDNLSTVNIYGGTFNWLPSLVTASVRTAASPSAAITTVNIYKGTFSAADMLQTDTTAPTITTANLYPNAIFNIANDYNNFVVTTIKDYGGSILKGANQALTIA